MLHYFSPIDDNCFRPPLYAIWDNCFTSQQLDILQSLARRAEEISKTGDGESHIVSKYRTALIRWIDKKPETEWVWWKLNQVIQLINNQYFKYDLTGLAEPPQLSDYREDVNGGYDWHVDSTPAGPFRKLSLAMQLSHPNEYEGGDFEFMIANKPERIDRQRGLIVVFPSNTVHRVTPVTAGSRQSLVQWITGPNFR
jgi:PKHD-type hydroxylase